VVKKALLLSSQQEEYRPILEATSGIAFLGVPHNGAGLAKYATFAASLSNPVGILGLPKPLRDDLLRGLRHSNDDLIELSEAFKGIGAKLNIKSFYERETMGGTCVRSENRSLCAISNTKSRWWRRLRLVWALRMRISFLSTRTTEISAASLSDKILSTKSSAERSRIW
jgi:hypothetical protein